MGTADERQFLFDCKKLNDSIKTEWYNKENIGFVRRYYEERGEKLMTQDRADNWLLINGNISSSYFRLAIPNVLSMVITLVYNLADTYFIAAVGNTDLVAGVSLCAPVLTIQMAFGNVFAQGGCSLVSRLLGASKEEEIRRVSAHCIDIGYLLGLAVGIFFLLTGQILLPFLGADADTIGFAGEYFYWIAAGSPFVVASYVYTNLFRSEGMSREAMLGTGIGAVVNIILDPIFISGLGMGAGGAAIATIIGYIVSDIYCTAILLKKSRILSMNPRYFRIPLEYEKQILGIGIPAAIMNIVQSLSVIFLNQFLLPYGNREIAAMGIAMKTVSIVNLVLVGLAYGGQPLFGYFFGAKDRENLKKLTRFTLKVTAGTAIVMSFAVFVAAVPLIRFFMEDPGIVESGSLMLRLQVATMTFAGITLLVTLIFQSAGNIGISFVLSIGRQGFIFLLVLAAASRLFGYYGILASQAVADVISVVLAAALFYRKIYRGWR